MGLDIILLYLNLQLVTLPQLFIIIPRLSTNTAPSVNALSINKQGIIQTMYTYSQDHPPLGLTASSTVTLTPRTEEQFGLVSCLATNPVGSQAQPCRFLTLPLLAPPPPEDCRAINITHQAFQVTYSPLPPLRPPPPAGVLSNPWSVQPDSLPAGDEGGGV